MKELTPPFAPAPAHEPNLGPLTEEQKPSNMVAALYEGVDQPFEEAEPRKLRFTGMGEYVSDDPHIDRKVGTLLANAIDLPARFIKQKVMGTPTFNTGNPLMDFGLEMMTGSELLYAPGVMGAGRAWREINALTGKGPRNFKQLRELLDEFPELLPKAQQMIDDAVGAGKAKLDDLMTSIRESSLASERGFFGFGDAPGEIRTRIRKPHQEKWSLDEWMNSYTMPKGNMMTAQEWLESMARAQEMGKIHGQSLEISGIVDWLHEIRAGATPVVQGEVLHKFGGLLSKERIMQKIEELRPKVVDIQLLGEDSIWHPKVLKNKNYGVPPEEVDRLGNLPDWEPETMGFKTKVISMTENPLAGPPRVDYTGQGVSLDVKIGEWEPMVKKRMARQQKVGDFLYDEGGRQIRPPRAVQPGEGTDRVMDFGRLDPRKPYWTEKEIDAVDLEVPEEATFNMWDWLLGRQRNPLTPQKAVYKHIDESPFTEGMKVGGHMTGDVANPIGWAVTNPRIGVDPSDVTKQFDVKMISQVQSDWDNAIRAAERRFGKPRPLVSELKDETGVFQDLPEMPLRKNWWKSLIFDSVSDAMEEGRAGVTVVDTDWVRRQWGERHFEQYTRNYVEYLKELAKDNGWEVKMLKYIDFDPERETKVAVELPTIIFGRNPTWKVDVPFVKRTGKWRAASQPILAGAGGIGAGLAVSAHEE